MTARIRRILDENEEGKKKLRIKSDFVFSKPNGDWIKTDAYESFLSRLFKSLDIKATGNHAFRRSLNSNVLIPLGIPETERAELLGHSVMTNLRNYSYEKKDNLDELRKLLSGGIKPGKMAENKGLERVVTSGHHKIIPFSA